MCVSVIVLNALCYSKSIKFNLCWVPTDMWPAVFYFPLVTCPSYIPCPWPLFYQLNLSLILWGKKKHIRLTFLQILHFSIIRPLIIFLSSSVQFSHSVVSGSLRPHESQHPRPLCPSPSPGVHSDSRPLSPWCHPAISSSVVPFSCPQSLPASESFPMSQLFAWSGRSIGISALVSFL